MSVRVGSGAAELRGPRTGSDGGQRERRGLVEETCQEGTGWQPPLKPVQVQSSCQSLALLFRVGHRRRATLPAAAARCHPRAGPHRPPAAVWDRSPPPFTRNPPAHRVDTEPCPSQRAVRGQGRGQWASVAGLQIGGASFCVQPVWALAPTVAFAGAWALGQPRHTSGRDRKRKLEARTAWQRARWSAPHDLRLVGGTLSGEMKQALSLTPGVLGIQRQPNGLGGGLLPRNWAAAVGGPRSSSERELSSAVPRPEQTCPESKRALLLRGFLLMHGRIMALPDVLP